MRGAMSPSLSYRRWIPFGCAAVCAALLALPGVARASKYDADLAPVSSASSHASVAAAPAPTPSSSKSSSSSGESRKGRGGSLPPWLSGATARRGSHHR